MTDVFGCFNKALTDNRPRTIKYNMHLLKAAFNFLVLQIHQLMKRERKIDLGTFVDDESDVELDEMIS